MKGNSFYLRLLFFVVCGLLVGGAVLLLGNVRTVTLGICLAYGLIGGISAFFLSNDPKSKPSDKKFLMTSLGIGGVVILISKVWSAMFLDPLRTTVDYRIYQELKYSLEYILLIFGYACFLLGGALQVPQKYSNKEG